MLPPGLFPRLIRPGIQRQPPPVGGTGVMPDSSSQGDAGNKDKSKEGEANEESNEENKAPKGMKIIIVLLCQYFAHSLCSFEEVP